MSVADRLNRKVIVTSIHEWKGYQCIYKQWADKRILENYSSFLFNFERYCYMRIEYISSSNLKVFREMADCTPYLAQFFDILPKIRLIIDSNVIIGDLIWLVNKRKNASAKTALQEIIEAGAVKAFAPNKLRYEIHHNLPKVANDRGLDLESLRNEWGEYQSYLRFADGGVFSKNERENAVDPNDLEFVYLYSEVGAAAVVSKDKHIKKMGAHSINLDLIITIRNYARSKVADVMFKSGIACFSLTTIVSFLLAFKVSKKVIGTFSQLPAVVKIFLIAGLIFSLITPKIRSSVLKFLSAISNGAYDCFCDAGVLLLDIIKCVEPHMGSVSNSESIIKERLPVTHRVPLKKIAKAVLIDAGLPLTLNEIEQGVLFNGYKSKSKNFKKYLKQVMDKERDAFICVDGRWALR